MQLVRPVFALDPTPLRPRPVRVATRRQLRSRRGSADDLKLFAATFLAGFLFVSILIG